MELKWLHPKIEREFLFEDIEYMILSYGNTYVSTFRGFDAETGHDIWWFENDGKVDIPIGEIQGYYPIPLGNSEAEKLLSMKITDLEEFVRRKVELEKEIYVLRKEIERTYELFKITNKSND